MKQSWYSRLKERSRAWLLPVHIILAVWFFLFVGNLEAGFPAARVLMPAYMIIMLGPVAFLVINLPLSIYTAVKLRKGQTDGENRTILIVFAALNAFIGLVVWGFLIAFILLAKDIEIPKVSEQIPAGYIEKAEHFDPDGFQDFTNYCKYVYPVGFVPADDPSFHEVTEAEIPDLQGYFDNFRGWMETAKRLDEYDFEPDCIGRGDYVRIETREGTPINDTGDFRYRKYDDYSVFFYDTEGHTMYYIHQNI